MKHRKMTSAVMAAVMAATAITGCGGTKSRETAKTPAQSLSANESGEFAYPMKTSETLTYWTELNQNVSANYSNLGETPFAKAWMKETGVTVSYSTAIGLFNSVINCAMLIITNKLSRKYSETSLW